MCFWGQAYFYQCSTVRLPLPHQQHKEVWGRGETTEILFRYLFPQISSWSAGIGFFVCLFFVFVFCLFRAAPVAYGGSQARGWIGAVATSLCHSNTGSEPHLQPIPQLTVVPDPQPTEQGQGSNLCPHGYQSHSFLLSHDGNSEDIKFKPIKVYRTKMKSLREPMNKSTSTAKGGKRRKIKLCKGRTKNTKWGKSTQ